MAEDHLVAGNGGRAPSCIGWRSPILAGIMDRSQQTSSRLQSRAGVLLEPAFTAVRAIDEAQRLDAVLQAQWFWDAVEALGT